MHRVGISDAGLDWTSVNMTFRNTLSFVHWNHLIKLYQLINVSSWITNTESSKNGNFEITRCAGFFSYRAETSRLELAELLSRKWNCLSSTPPAGVLNMGKVKPPPVLFLSACDAFNYLQLAR